MNEPPRRVTAWRHRDARDGFEALFISSSDAGDRCDGDVAAVEDRSAWAVRYSVLVDPSWTTRSVHIAALSAAGGWDLRLEADGRGGWHVGGVLVYDAAGLILTYPGIAERVA